MNDKSMRALTRMVRRKDIAIRLLTRGKGEEVAVAIMDTEKQVYIAVPVSQATGFKLLSEYVLDLSWHEVATLFCAIAGYNLNELLVKASGGGTEVVAPTSPDDMAVKAVDQILTWGHNIDRDAALKVALTWGRGKQFEDYMQLALDYARSAKP